jgi:hypothetical protein
MDHAETSPMTDENRMSIARAMSRYNVAMHAVQSGIAMSENYDKELFSPKNTRVGITSAQVTDLAIGELLIKKGVISRLEYFEAVADAAESEKERWENELSSRLGKKVTLA